jgi:hypothetical protein
VLAPDLAAAFGRAQAHPVDGTTGTTPVGGSGRPDRIRTIAEEAAR